MHTYIVFFSSRNGLRLRSLWFFGNVGAWLVYKPDKKGSCNRAVQKREYRRTDFARDSNGDHNRQTRKDNGSFGSRTKKIVNGAEEYVSVFGV